jgi:hypothetical protein
VNYCRLYLEAYLASDIVSPDGRTIHPSVFKGTLAQRPNTPSMKFPRQGQLGPMAPRSAVPVHRTSMHGP